MKRFRFQQQSLLRLKTQLCRMAEMRVLRAQNCLQAAHQQRRRLETDLEQMAAVATGVTACDGDAGWNWCRHVSQVQVQVQDAGQQIEEISLECQEKRAALREIRSELEALTALRDLRWREHLTDAAKEQQQELDQTAMSRWAKPQSSDDEGSTDD